MASQTIGVTPGTGVLLRTDRISGADISIVKLWEGTADSTTPVVLNDKLGIVNEAAPTTDTASSGLNGRLQRIAQNITTLTAASGSAAVSTYHYVTDGTDNVNVSASATYLKAVHVSSVRDTPLYVKFHNTAGAPTIGAGVVYAIGVQAGLSRDVIFPGRGREFTTGLGMTVVTGMADSNTTAVAAGDALIEVHYGA